jgi:hypothetical protein
VQSLSYAGHTLVEVLRTSPGQDEPVLRANGTAGGADGSAPDSIPVRGADGGLAFGLDVQRSVMQTVFDATFYRPVNTSFTGRALLLVLCSRWAHRGFP